MRDAEPDVGEHHEQEDDEQTAEQTEFFTDDREDEVVVGVGQIVPLGPALPEPDAEDSPVGQRIGGLPFLVSGALRIVDVVEDCLLYTSPSPRD